MILSSGSKCDVHTLPPAPDPYSNGNNDPTGRTLVSPALVPGELTKVIITVGQSLMSNFSGGPLTIIAPTKIDNLNILNGGTYHADHPMLGCDGTLYNQGIRLADKMIQGGDCARVIIVSAAVGGSNIAQWAPNGAFHARIAAIASRVQSAGLTPSYILMEIGTTDAQAGTTQAAFKASMQAVITAFRQQPGMTSVPFLIAKSTWASGVLGTAVRAAIDEIAPNPGAFIYAGPDNDTIADRRDTVHYDATGADAAATKWRNAILAIG
jgi:hypothetical protein